MSKLKMPKNRQTIYTVVRYDPDDNYKTLIDSFCTFEAAQDQADSYTQDLKDRGLSEIKYNVECSTYYD